MKIETTEVRHVEPSAEEAAAALAKAAETAPQPEEEARAQLAAKAEEAAAPTPERPQWLPEKFKSAEDLAKAYAELEKKVGTPAKEEAEASDTEKSKDGDEKKTEDEPAKASEVVTKLNESFAANGELSEADYALAESIGHDRATVDDFIAGQKALADQATQRITDAAGGKESMDRMFTWAKTGLSGSEIDTFNKSMEGKDVNAAVIAMEQLKARYEKANGRDPKLITGKPQGASHDTYGSWAEVSSDMSDPKYKVDPAFRQKVADKLGRSDNIRAV